MGYAAERESVTNLKALFDKWFYVHMAGNMCTASGMK